MDADEVVVVVVVDTDEVDGADELVVVDTPVLVGDGLVEETDEDGTVVATTASDVTAFDGTGPVSVGPDGTGAGRTSR